MDIAIELIERVEEGDQKALVEREVFWQTQLICYVQTGGHAHCFRKEKKYPTSVKGVYNSPPHQLSLQVNF